MAMPNTNSRRLVAAQGPAAGQMLSTELLEGHASDFGVDGAGDGDALQRSVRIKVEGT
jgi:hypothetical protein